MDKIESENFMAHWNLLDYFNKQQVIFAYMSF